MGTEEIRFSQTCTFGNHLYRREGEVAEVVFENPGLGIRRVIVNDSGRILGFPGIAHPELVSQYSKGHLNKQVRYRSAFRRLGDRYAMIWQIQPDGRYWEDDDGFGGTSDDEIELYARLDEEGKFIEPFRFYSIGMNNFYGTDIEDEIARVFSMKDDPLTSLREHIPELFARMEKAIQKPERAAVSYQIPGTVYRAVFSLELEQRSWYVRLGMSKCMSDTTLVEFLRFASLKRQREYLGTERAKEEAEQKMVDLFHAMESKK